MKMRRLMAILLTLMLGGLSAHGNAWGLTPILECVGNGITGDLAGDRGIRFTVNQSFSAIEVRMEGSKAGVYNFGAELRGSTGFVTAPEVVVNGLAVNVSGNTSSTPYKSVLINLGKTIAVKDTNTTFTLKFTNITGPGSLYFETYGIGQAPCGAAVQETEQNNVAEPTLRGAPAGFRALTGDPLAITSTYVTTPPTLDGSIGFGEWPNANRIQLGNGFLTVVNDRTRLYVLMDVLSDSGNDNSATSNDYFWLTFDKNRDGLITPNVDVNYGADTGTGTLQNMRYQYYLGSGSWTGRQPDTFSARGVGFGCFFADGTQFFGIFPHPGACDRHRVWEFGFDLAEIGTDPTGTARMGLRIASATPAFTEDFPANFYTDTGFGNLLQIQLAPPSGFTIVPSQLATLTLDANPLEITQAIQTRTNEEQLVADKVTVARVYAKTTNFASPQPSNVFLYGDKSGIDLPGSPMVRYFNAPTVIDRLKLNDTVNFSLPGSWDNTGTVNFLAKVRSLFGTVAGSVSTPLAFTAKETPTYWIVPVNSGTAATPVLPPQAEIEKQKSYLKTVFPVSNVNFVQKAWQDIGVQTSGEPIPALNSYYSNAALAWILGVIFGGGAPPFTLPDQIYGFTPSGGGNSDPSWGGGTGHVARGYIGTSGEGTMAHEIAHNLGTGDCAHRATDGMWGRHVSSQGKLSVADDPTGQCITGDAGFTYGCNAAGPDPDWQVAFNDAQIHEVGFDTRLPWAASDPARKTVVPSTYPDFMSYCQSGVLPTKWISTYRWDRLFNRFQTVAAASFGAQATAALVARITDVFYISGNIYWPEGQKLPSGNLDPLLVQPGLATDPVPVGDYALELRDAKGSLLSEPFLFVAAFSDVEGNRREIVPFHFRLPAVQGVASIRLMYGRNIVLDQLYVTSNPPAIAISSPASGEVWPGGTATINWEAGDPDKDPLTFNILYSPDSGSAWFPVASGLTAMSYKVNTSTLPPTIRGQMSLIKVIVTDGFNTAEATSGKFTVTTEKRDPPQVTIVEPGGDMLFPSGKPIHFQGVAVDAQGGTLPDENFGWTADDAGIGTGSELDAILPDGLHKIRLGVIDSAGNVGVDAIQILVVALCHGEFDQDGDVDGVDLATFARQLGLKCDGTCPADFNGDGIIDINDLAMLAEDFGRADCPKMNP